MLATIVQWLIKSTTHSSDSLTNTGSQGLFFINNVGQALWTIAGDDWASNNDYDV